MLTHHRTHVLLFSSFLFDSFFFPHPFSLFHPPSSSALQTYMQPIRPNAPYTQCRTRSRPEGSKKKETTSSKKKLISPTHILFIRAAPSIREIYFLISFSVLYVYRHIIEHTIHPISETLIINQLEATSIPTSIVFFSWPYTLVYVECYRGLYIYIDARTWILHNNTNRKMWRKNQKRGKKETRRLI